MASPTQWTRVWVNSGRWWRTGKPGVLQSIDSPKVGNDWLNNNSSFLRGLKMTVGWRCALSGKSSNAVWLCPALTSDLPQTRRADSRSLWSPCISGVSTTLRAALGTRCLCRASTAKGRRRGGPDTITWFWVGIHSLAWLQALHSRPPPHHLPPFPRWDVGHSTSSKPYLPSTCSPSLKFSLPGLFFLQLHFMSSYLSSRPNSNATSSQKPSVTHPCSMARSLLPHIQCFRLRLCNICYHLGFICLHFHWAGNLECRNGEGLAQIP